MKAYTNQQRLHAVNTEQLYDAYRAAVSHDASHRFGMRWKTVAGTEYLFRASDRRGGGKTLGRRNEQTEAVLRQFEQGRHDAHERVRALELRINEQARLNKALRLARVPRVVGRVLRTIDALQAGRSFMVLGTQAMYAYEAIGGAFFMLELLASGDVDLLYDARVSIEMVSRKFSGEGLLGVLKKADRTFECVRKRGFRAANSSGFMVDLITPPRSMRDSAPITFGDDDVVAAEVPGLQWLNNAPKVEACAVDEDGWPVPMRVPDPRYFALHKAWLAQQGNREPLKSRRDMDQAKALSTMIKEYMPQLRFDDALASLHGDVRAMRPLLGI